MSVNLLKVFGESRLFTILFVWFFLVLNIFCCVSCMQLCTVLQSSAVRLTGTLVREVRDGSRGRNIRVVFSVHTGRRSERGDGMLLRLGRCVP